ncbi:MAG: prolipoprotein diacylglyceryl transferase [Phycisphaerae bacterium]|nr:prolipoprotein diacylglyceryl transferase [Phycisphaerae bacterium]
MQQVIIDFGQVNLFGHSVALRIYGYGLMLVLGFICSTFLARRRAKRFGESPDVIVTVGLLSLVSGIVGARLAYVIEKWQDQFAWRSDPMGEILDITSGGLIYFGGVVLAVVVVWVYLRVKRLPIRRYLDILAPVVMLGLAFGRMGCTLNGCCYGGRCNTDYPLAMRFPYASRPLLLLDDKANVFGGSSVSPVYSHQVAVGPDHGGLDVKDLPPWLFVRDSSGRILHNTKGGPILKTPLELTGEQAREADKKLRSLPVQPAQVFGVINALLITGLLLCYSRLRRREGEVFSLMLILYPITRFALEGIRGDNPHNLLKLELTHNQYTSLGMMVLGLVLFICLRYFRPSAGGFWYERSAAADRGVEGVAKRQKRKR